MLLVRGLSLLAVGLAAAPTGCALVPPTPLPRTTAGGHAAATARGKHVRQIASWRGGAVESSEGGPPLMNVQLGLVRVAGYGIIAGSLCLKTPQIARVWHAKSLVGLAPASIYADVFLFATSVIYHVLKKNPIRAYGESVVVLFQTLVMVGLLWRFGAEEEVAVSDGGGDEEALVTKSTKKVKPAGGGPVGRTAIVAGSVAASVLCVLYLPERLWGLLVIVSTPTILAVQLPQIWKNWRQKHTGELAVLTVLLAFVGSSIRIATTIADLGGDPWLLFNYVLGATSNATILAQIYLYRALTATVGRDVEAKAHKAAHAA
ncbi:conserved unknown protein [Ectocarpus siliculosus]|uniref:Uncharacterized protein n=1 Tax=Ectocarpus siliculosus TaxID=2880 RepID=D8LNI5_ECTSI|nr:conserved unknown protein [Ectocarpus siliculosus]|eukprot:CBN79860.1 conserved unknown protein [Ectocarpus siliculosus]